MGLKRNLGEDAANFLAVHYRPEIDEILEQIAEKLANLFSDEETTVAVANLTADLTTVVFQAGMAFQETLS